MLDRVPAAMTSSMQREAKAAGCRSGSGPGTRGGRCIPSVPRRRSPWAPAAGHIRRPRQASAFGEPPLVMDKPLVGGSVSPGSRTRCPRLAGCQDLARTGRGEPLFGGLPLIVIGKRRNSRPRYGGILQ
jgi:hypothetical protein